MIKRNRKYVFNVLLVLTLVVFVLSTKDLYSYLFSREARTIKYGADKNREIKLLLDSLTSSIEDVTVDLANSIIANDYSDRDLFVLVKDQTHRFENCLGTTIAFARNKRKRNDSLYCLYYDKRNDQTLRIDTLYDYTSELLSTSVWYTNISNARKGVWSEPYFAEGANNLVVDYGYPILDKGEFIGVVSYTLSLKNFSDYLKELSLGVAGYGFLSKDSSLITHPKIDLVLNKELSKKILSEISKFDDLLKQEKGNFNFYSHYTFQESTLFFSRLQNGWTLSLVINVNDILNKGDEFIKTIITLSVSLSAVFILVVLFFSFGRGFKHVFIWRISSLVTILIIGNVVLFWFLRYTHANEGELNSRDKIVNNHILSNMLSTHNEKLRQLQIEPSIQIPTGIQVNEIDFKGAYDVAICGEIWQKIPLDFEVRNKTFDFAQKTPQGFAVRTSLLSKERAKDYWLYKYEYIANLQMGFNYASFPLDFRVINIQLHYPYKEENVMLIPDLESYNILDPSSKPGISHYINVPSAEITSSFFSLFEYQNKTDVSASRGEGLNNSLHLEFDVLVKRNILNPVITNILPIFVVAILIFLLPFTVKKENGELVEGSALSVIQASGGFFFILLLAHIQLRRTIMAPEILYLESFYIIMYVMIAVMSALILMIVKSDNYKFLESDNNFAIKAAYWPFLLFLMLISSFIFLH